MKTTLFLMLMALLLIAAHKLGLKADRTNNVFGGVCAGIADYTNMSIPLVRVLTVILTLITGGFTIPLYILLWITLPSK